MKVLALRSVFIILQIEMNMTGLESKIKGCFYNGLDGAIELIFRCQIEDYIPPPAVNGQVPRNAYGNVELFLPKMLPGGTKHLQIPGTQSCYSSGLIFTGTSPETNER